MIRVLSIALLLVLGACSTTAPEPRYYLLRSDQDQSTRTMALSPDYVLGSMTIAPYIDQRGLILETQEGEMRPARTHLWAEPLYEGARIFLMTEVSRAKGQDILPDTVNRDGIRLNIRIDQLHGTADGKARLVAYWWLQKGDKVLKVYQFSEERQLQEGGYPALARAEKELLAELAERMAETLVDPAELGLN